MTKVFVHGNPETSAVWDDLIAELHARGVTDTVLLSPPGFGAPVPAGWGATQDEYREWLIGELRSVAATGSSIDLVSHDWGAGHAFGALAREPGLVRTWASDCMGLVHRDYVWHDMAQAWQTPDVGETVVQMMTGSEPAQFADMMEPLGMRRGIAEKVSAALDGETARCILALYRSAAQPAMAELGARFVSASPANGLVILAENDHFAGPAGAHREVATAVGAAVAEIKGAGHWWMIEKPAEAADILVAHWNR